MSSHEQCIGMILKDFCMVIPDNYTFVQMSYNHVSLGECLQLELLWQTNNSLSYNYKRLLILTYRCNMVLLARCITNSCKLDIQPYRKSEQLLEI